MRAFLYAERNNECVSGRNTSSFTFVPFELPPVRPHEDGRVIRLLKVVWTKESCRHVVGADFAVALQEEKRSCLEHCRLMNDCAALSRARRRAAAAVVRRRCGGGAAAVRRRCGGGAAETEERRRRKSGGGGRQTYRREDWRDRSVPELQRVFEPASFTKCLDWAVFVEIP